MVFSSLLFIFRFMPAALLVYYLTPKKFKNLSLLIISLIFYSWGEAKYFFLMAASIFVDYFISMSIEKYRERKNVTKVLVILSVIFNLGMLGVFKYMNFFIDNINLLLGLSIKNVAITLPLGISFYTFQIMSYTIDVYRGNAEAERNIINFGAYVSMFPQLIAGPIVKYSDISRELKDRTVNADKIEEGIEQFILGLSKKVLIANNIGLLWNEVSGMNMEGVSTGLAWLGVLAFSFQIYFDFAGYSSMAIGLGKMLGFNFPQNFNYPYISRSISEFWRRWHMTLGSWFREYVYIPLGGNRVGKLRLYFNLFVVWSLTGFWHGANYNFILWGILFFILISVEKVGFIKFLDSHKVLSHVYVIFFLLIGWTVFAVEDFAQLKQYLAAMFSFRGGLDVVYYIRNYGVTLIIAAIFSTPALEKLINKRIAKTIVYDFMLLALFVVSVAYLVDATYNPFLYFRF